MKLVALLFLCFSSLALAEKPKIGVLDMDRIFLESNQKVEIEKEVLEKVEALQTSPRVLAVQEMDAKLKALAKTVRDKELATDKRELAAKEFNSLSIEYQSLVQEMDEFLRDEKRNAKRILVESVEALVAEVREVVEQVGKEMEVDFILETKGKTSSQVSPIIYLREKVDLTDEVLSRLKILQPDTSPEENPSPATED